MFRFTKSVFAWLVLSLCFLIQAKAQDVITAAFSSDDWKVEARKSEFTTIKGTECIYLEHGAAILNSSDFKVGIIDYDVMFEPGRKFAGIQFRMADEHNYEEFYMRAHQSGNPDATQYTPVYNENAGWQLYHGEGYSAAKSYKFGEWIHVRLIVGEKDMDVYVEDMAQPLIRVYDLKRKPESGKIGFWSFLGGAWYGNLSYQSMESPPPLARTLEMRSPPAGTITEWEVSSAFKVEDFFHVRKLEDFEGLNKLSWQSYPVEYTGTINLARVSPVTPNTNTVLVKTVIRSEQDQLKQLDFGYSDMAVLYVNGEIVYSGHNQFRSRDYRYLGTIGYFDGVYLRLKEGKNEIVFAVYETSGGWGIKAKLENLEGIIQ